MVHQGRRYFSKRSQCLCVLLFIASLISYVDAVQVEKVQNKQEAIQACDQSHQYDNSETYQRVIPLYQTIDDNDVFMDCQGNEEHITEFNRKNKCDPTKFGKAKKEGPVHSIYYRCQSGKLELLLCDIGGESHCKSPFATLRPNPGLTH